MGGGGGSNEVPETSQEKALARIATEQWARYEETFKPLEDKWIENITADPANTKASVRADVAGDIGSRYDEAQTANDKGALAAGVNVNSGAFKQSLSRGEDVGKGLSRANLGVTANKTGELMNAISIGRGQAADGQSSMTDVARLAVRDTISKKTRDFQDGQDTEAAIGTGAGMLTRQFT